MKKYKTLFFLLIFVFVLPIFNFGCGEVAFEDVPYSLSSLTSSEIVEKVDTSKSQAISTEIKMKLNTKISFNFFGVRDESIRDREIKKEVVSYLGKDRDANIFSQTEKTFVDGDLCSTVEKTYEKGEQNSTNNIYCYTLSKEIASDDVEVVTDFSRSKMDYTATTTLTNLYTSVINKISGEEFDSVYQKTFEDVTYYKMYADVNGIKNKFSLNENIYNTPQLFEKKEKNDYIMSCSCEIGFKESSGSTYVSYFTINYSVYNTNREKYLEVKTKTVLDDYGDKVSVKEIGESKGEYIANGFVMQMNKNNSFCVYNRIINDVAEVDKTYSVLKIEKQDENDDTQTYFEYAIKIVTTRDKYYYLKRTTEEDATVYKMYEIDEENRKLREVDDVNIDEFLSFNFSLKYEGVAEGNDKHYKFGVNTSNTAIMKVYVNDDKVSVLKNASAELQIQRSGIFNDDLDVIYNIDNYQIEVEEP